MCYCLLPLGKASWCDWHFKRLCWIIDKNLFSFSFAIFYNVVHKIPLVQANGISCYCWINICLLEHWTSSNRHPLIHVDWIFPCGLKGFNQKFCIYFGRFSWHQMLGDVDCGHDYIKFIWCIGFHALAKLKRMFSVRRRETDFDSSDKDSAGFLNLGSMKMLILISFFL